VIGVLPNTIQAREALLTMQVDRRTLRPDFSSPSVDAARTLA